MARSWELTIEDYPPIDPSVYYPVVVQAIRRAGKAQEMILELAHLGPEQAGRTHHDIRLALPVRPGNLAAAFFCALGLLPEAKAGKTINPRAAIGHRALARFELDQKTTCFQVTEFKPILEQRYAS